MTKRSIDGYKARHNAYQSKDRLSKAKRTRGHNAEHHKRRLSASNNGVNQGSTHVVIEPLSRAALLLLSRTGSQEFLTRACTHTEHCTQIKGLSGITFSVMKEELDLDFGNF